jgi:hypothetical protein
MINPKLILLMFSILEWLLAWSVRLIPRRNNSSAFQRGIVPLLFCAMAGGGIIAEVLLYGSLTGHHSLRDDNFFFVTMIVEGLGMIAIALKSEAVLRQREGETRLGK